MDPELQKLIEALFGEDSRKKEEDIEVGRILVEAIFAQQDTIPKTNQGLVVDTTTAPNLEGNALLHQLLSGPFGQDTLAALFNQLGSNSGPLVVEALDRFKRFDRRGRVAGMFDSRTESTIFLDPNAALAGGRGQLSYFPQTFTSEDFVRGTSLHELGHALSKKLGLPQDVAGGELGADMFKGVVDALSRTSKKKDVTTRELVELSILRANEGRGSKEMPLIERSIKNKDEVRRLIELVKGTPIFADHPINAKEGPFAKIIERLFGGTKESGTG